MPSVIKATAIVNGDVITQTDVDQRLALLAIANGGQIPAEEVERLRQQVLRNLIDETLEIQAAKAEKIEVKTIGHRPDRRARRGQRQADPRPARRLSRGATDPSIKSLRRQIEGEIAWQRLQSAKIESGVSVGDDEVKAVLDRLNASKGTEEYRVGEIFLSATPGDAGADPRQCQQDPRAAAQRRIVCRLCAPIFGSLDRRGRRRSRLGPARAAAGAARATCFAQMPAGLGQQPDSRCPAAFRSSRSRTPARS